MKGVQGHNRFNDKYKQYCSVYWYYIFYNYAF